MRTFHNNVQTWDTGNNCGAGKKGRICQIDDPHQSLELGYDAYGALTLQRPTLNGQTGYLHRFSYDELGRLETIEYPGNVFVDYDYTLDRITAMTARLNTVTHTVADTIALTALAGDPGNQGSQYRIRHGNGPNRDERFDLDGRLSRITTGGGYSLDYGYDANDRLTELTHGTIPTASQAYAYDDLDRLQTATSGLGDQGFTHDASGNRLSHTQSAGTSDYAIASSSNRIDTISGSLNRSYSYKTTGQVSQITGPLSQGQSLPKLLQPQARTTHAQPKANELFSDGFEPDLVNTEYSFSYDRTNRLSAITGPGLNASYQIGATGMRVAKTVNGQTTRFVYGLNGQLLHEHDTSTGRRTQHLYLNGKPIALVRNNGPGNSPVLYHLHTDHLGRAERITDPNNTIVWRAQLAAFNRTVVIDTIGGYHLGFPGQYHDTETGFAYNIHRDYDPATGRYLQSDPIGLNGGINTYAYVGGNPINFVDPLGLKDHSGCETERIINNARFDSSNGNILQRTVNVLSNHSGLAREDIGLMDYGVRAPGDTFSVDGNVLNSASFGNYLAGYAGIYYAGRVGLAGVLAGGVMYNAQDAIFGNEKFNFDADSVLDIYRGAYRAKEPLNKSTALTQPHIQPRV